MNSFMSLFFYEQWYKNDVSPNLDFETKKKIAEKISEISQKDPIFEPGYTYSLDTIPELRPYTKLSEFTGMQLYATLTEIMKELGAVNTRSASEIAMEVVK